MKKLSIFKNEDVLNIALKTTTEVYRLYDPGWYLYRLVFNYKGKKFSHEFIELVYVTLSAWNMNSRGAKLSEFEIFENSILKNKNLKILNSLNGKANFINNDNIDKEIKYLFYNLVLVDSDKPPLVTFSKAMHFFFPELVVPIDRKYSCNYFYNSINIPKEIDKQWKMFLEIQKEFCDFSKNNDLLLQFIDNNWNLCKNKIMDNMIIGYTKLIKALIKKCQNNEATKEEEKMLLKLCNNK